MTLEERLQRLEDDRAIRDLKARNLRACDAHDPDALCDTFSHDAKIRIDGLPPFENRDDFVAVFRELVCVSGVQDIHHAANGVITFETVDRATGKWALLFHNINLSARTVTQFGIEYDDVYVRSDGRWWIATTQSMNKSVLVQAVGSDGSIAVTTMDEAHAAN